MRTEAQRRAGGRHALSAVRPRARRPAGFAERRPASRPTSPPKDASAAAFRALLEQGPAGGRQARIDAEAAEQISALEETVPRVRAAAAAASSSKSAKEGFELERTMLRSAIAPRIFVVTVTDGRSSIRRRLDRTLFIGRAPVAPLSPLAPTPPVAPDAPAGRAADTELVAIGEGDAGLEATHLQLSVSGSRIFARDLGSRTGAIIAPPGASSFRLEAGGRTALEPGSRVRIGDRVTVTVAVGVPAGVGLGVGVDESLEVSPSRRPC